jgi:hypothetical protein
VENGDDLHVFEPGGKSNGADVGAYDGEHEYVDHYWEEALMTRGTCGMRSDSNSPLVGGTEADISENELDTASKKSCSDWLRRPIPHGERLETLLQQNPVVLGAGPHAMRSCMSSLSRWQMWFARDAVNTPHSVPRMASRRADF